MRGQQVSWPRSKAEKNERSEGDFCENPLIQEGSYGLTYSFTLRRSVIINDSRGTSRGSRSGCSECLGDRLDGVWCRQAEARRSPAADEIQERLQSSTRHAWSSLLSSLLHTHHHPEHEGLRQGLWEHHAASALEAERVIQRNQPAKIGHRRPGSPPFASPPDTTLEPPLFNVFHLCIQLWNASRLQRYPSKLTLPSSLPSSLLPASPRDS